MIDVVRTQLFSQHYVTEVSGKNETNIITTHFNRTRCELNAVVAMEASTDNITQHVVLSAVKRAA